MTTQLLNALFAVDDKAIAEALRSLSSATNGASEEQLQVLHKAGHIPTGVLSWLLACRAPIV
jgi:hypothetical protein